MPSLSPLSWDNARSIEQYFTKVLLFAPSKSLLVVGLLSVVGALAATGYFSWQGIEKWGRTQKIVAAESPLAQSAQLSSLWYSPGGDLCGYRQDGWKVTLIRWSAGKNFSAMSTVLDLEGLTSNIDPAAQRPSASATQTWTEPLQMRGANRARGFDESNAAAGSLSSMPLVAVSQDLTQVVWAWRSKLFRTNIDTSSGVANSSTRSAARLPVEITDLVDVHFINSHGLILQDESNQRILIYDHNKSVTVDSFKAPAPCPVDVSMQRAAVLCPLSGDLIVFDSSSFPALKQARLQVPRRDASALGATAVMLSTDGTPVVSTDSGAILFWPLDRNGNRPLHQLVSPGVAQSLGYVGESVLVGGGFRGIYQLREGADPVAVINDVTNITLLAINGLKFGTKGINGGNLAFRYARRCAPCKPPRSS